MNTATPTELRDTVCRLIEGVHSGRVDPRVASGLAPLLSLQLRVIEKVEFEPRLKAVEEAIRQIRNGKANDEVPVEKGLDTDDDDEI